MALGFHRENKAGMAEVSPAPRHVETLKDSLTEYLKYTHLSFLDSIQIDSSGWDLLLERITTYNTRGIGRLLAHFGHLILLYFV